MARDACDGPLLGLLGAGADGQAVLPAVWAACPEGVTRGLVLLYEQDPQDVSRVLEVCQVRLWPCLGPCMGPPALQRSCSFAQICTCILCWPC